MDIREMTGEEIEARIAEIKEAIPTADSEKLEELRSELNAIEERKAEIKAKVEERERVAIDETLTRITEMPKENREMAEINYNAESAVYRSAWLKDIATRKDDGFKILGDMTPEERTAFTFMTTNTGSVVPTVTLNRIIELVESMAPMYDDATPSNMTQGFAVPRHKRILAGDAAATDEGVANEDENDEFDLLAIDGTEIKKHVEISRKMKWESIDAFEDWLVEHLSQRIAVAKETTIIAALNDSTVGIASTNILPAVTADNDGVLEVLSLIKGTGTKVWYANQKTIFSRIAKITDENGRPLFIPSTEDSDPLVAGRIYGGKVKLDENLADDVFYAGVSKKILANDFEKLFIASNVDPKTFKNVIGGYSLFGAGLENPNSFVKGTFTNPTPKV